MIRGALMEGPHVFAAADSQSPRCSAVVVLPEPIMPSIRIRRLAANTYAAASGACMP